MQVVWNEMHLLTLMLIDLRRALFLRRSRGLSDNYYKDPDVKPSSSLSSKQLLKFSRGGTILCTILFHLEVANPIQCKVHPFDAVNDPFTVQ